MTTTPPKTFQHKIWGLPDESDKQSPPFGAKATASPTLVRPSISPAQSASTGWGVTDSGPHCLPATGLQDRIDSLFDLLFQHLRITHPGMRRIHFGKQTRPHSQTFLGWCPSQLIHEPGTIATCHGRQTNCVRYCAHAPTIARASPHRPRERTHRAHCHHPDRATTCPHGAGHA
jgi:hypothetical protein